MEFDTLTGGNMDFDFLTGANVGGFLGALIGFLVIFVLFFFIIAIILYIFNGLGLSKIAKNQNLNNSWFAWVPILNVYLLGKIAMDDNVGIALAVLMGLMTFASKIPFLGFAGLGYIVLYFIATHKLFDKLSDKAVVMTVFNVLSFGMLTPIFLFAIRKNQERVITE